jgi:hypothetical protein
MLFTNIFWLKSPLRHYAEKQLDFKPGKPQRLCTGSQRDSGFRFFAIQLIVLCGYAVVAEFESN